MRRFELAALVCGAMLILPGSAGAATPVDDALRTDTENVATFPPPDALRIPVFNANLPSPGGDRLSFGGSRVATATGGGRLWAVGERADSVTSWDLATSALDVPFALRGNTHPRGLAYYRNEVFVGDAGVGEVEAYRPQGAQTAPPRKLPLPQVLSLVEPSLPGACSATCPQEAVPALENLTVTGVDVAWNEVWVSMAAGSRAGRLVLAMDAQTGTPKAAVFQIAKVQCNGPQRRLLGGQIDCAGVAADSKPLTVVCTKLPPLSTGGSTPTINANGLVAHVKDCQGDISKPAWAYTTLPTAGSAWDIATAPESGQVITGCTAIVRSALVSATSLGATPSVDQAVSYVYNGDGPVDCDETQQDGIDAVWGMGWTLEAGYGGEIRERPTTSGIAQQHRRRWRPQTSTGGRDISYLKRETRIDWKGNLTDSEWQRGGQCLEYIVSDADLYPVGEVAEHWYELARGFVDIKLFIDGGPAGQSTAPNGTFCVDTETLSSGSHNLELRATVGGGAVVSRSNPSLRIDRDPPTGAVNGLPPFVSGPIDVTGAMSDAHAGPRDAQIDFSGPRAHSCAATPSGANGQIACAWDTRIGPDGRYSIAAKLRDLLGRNGPNTAVTGTISTFVDNTPPTLSVTGELFERQDLAPINAANSYGAHIAASDGGSGATSVTVQIDGQAVDQRAQACPQGGCELTHDYVLTPDNLSDGQHTITVVATDALGQATQRTWTVMVEVIPPFTDGDLAALDGSGSTSRSATAVDPIGVASNAAAQLVAGQPGSADGADLLTCTAEGLDAGFDVFSLGESFEGLQLTESFRRCETPEGLWAWRANMTTYIYGDCEADDDLGCAAPVEVQTWPACERSWADYESAAVTDAVHGYTRGVPSVSLDGGRRLELYTGRSTVVIFGDDPAQVLRAASDARVEGQSSPGTKLPEPLTGSIEGTLRCASPEVRKEVNR